jgi:ribose/xylose/arabinose/galactoside ABC-type transport system permease subunit
MSRLKIHPFISSNSIVTLGMGIVFAAICIFLVDAYHWGMHGGWHPIETEALWHSFGATPEPGAGSEWLMRQPLCGFLFAVGFAIALIANRFARRPA